MCLVSIWCVFGEYLERVFGEYFVRGAFDATSSSCSVFLHA